MTSMNFGDITRHILKNLGGNLSQLDGYTLGGGTGSKDDVVSLAEFSNYFKDELGADYNANKDIIVKFFNKLNSNKTTANRLDKNELSNADKTFKTYEAVEVKIDELNLDVNVPTGLSGVLAESWKKAVEEDIYAQVEKNLKSVTPNEDGTYNVDNILTPEFLNTTQNKQAVLCYQTELTESLKKDMLADYPDYKPADDKEIDKIINLYIKANSENWSAGTDFETIKTDLESLITEYYNLAVDSEKAKESGTLTALGYKSSGLNDLQVEVAKKELKEALLDKYKSQVDQKVLDNALEKFIKAQVEKAGNFTEFMEQIRNIGSEGGLDLTSLDLMFEAEKWRDFDISNAEGSIYNKVKAKVGENLAKVIAENERYIKEYGNVIDEAVKKIEAGDISTQAQFEEFVLEKIMQNLSSFLGGVDANDMSVKDLGTLYDNLAASADAMEDTDASLKLHKEAAITYCDAIAKKGEVYKKEIEKVFGSTDYKSVINDALPSKIKSLITELKDAVKDIVVIDYNNASSLESDTTKTAIWSGLNSEYTVAVGQTIPMFKAIETYGDDKKPADAYAIDVNGSASVTIDALGNINIKGSSEVGITTVTVHAIVDGKKIGGAHTFTIKSEPAEMIASANDKGIADDSILKGVTGGIISDFVENNALNSQKETVIAGLVSFVDTLANDLNATTKYTESKVNAAAKATKSYFEALINVLTDKTGGGYTDSTFDSNSFTYVNAKGESVTETAKYRHIQDDTENGAKEYGKEETKWAEQSGVAILENVDWGSNDFAIYLDKQKVAQKFIEFFNTLL